MKFLVIVLHFEGALGCPIANGYGLVVHPHLAAGTNNRYLSFEVLPEAKFGGMTVQLGLGYCCGEVVGLAIAFDLLPHGVFD